MRRQMTRVDQATRVPEAGELAIVLLGDRAAMLSYAANRRPGADAGCRPAAPLRAPASGATRPAGRRDGQAVARYSKRQPLSAYYDPTS